MSDLDRYTTWKVPMRWGEIIKKFREKHKEDLILRGVTSNSGAVLFILTKIMEKEGLLDEFDFSYLPSET